MAERRKQERLTFGEPSTLVCKGEACLLVDISMSGLRITFIGDEEAAEYGPEVEELRKELDKETG